LTIAKAVHYGELAAKHATEVFAYGEATRQLDRALVVQDLVHPGNAVWRCDLLLALGEALWPAGETERVIAHVAPEALAVAEALGDRSRAFRACRLAADCLDAQGGPAVTFRPEYLRWAEPAHGYTDVDSKDRIYADLALSWAWLADRHRQHAAHELRLEALALARQHDDPEGLFRSAFRLMLVPGAPQNFPDERLHLAAESTSWPRQGVSGGSLRSVRAVCLAQLGRLEEARALVGPSGTKLQRVAVTAVPGSRRSFSFYKPQSLSTTAVQHKPSLRDLTEFPTSPLEECFSRASHATWETQRR
jgi:hypothetical protein